MSVVAATILVGGVDMSHYLDYDALAKKLDTEFKGAGVGNYGGLPFTFTLVDNGLPIEIKLDLPVIVNWGGLRKFSGYIKTFRKRSRIEITAVPWAALLGESPIGEPIRGTSPEVLRFTSDAKNYSVRDNIRKALAAFTPTRNGLAIDYPAFTLDDESIPDPVIPDNQSNRNFVGDEKLVDDPLTFGAILVRAMVPKYLGFTFTDSLSIRKKSANKHYVVWIDGGLNDVKVFKRSQFLKGKTWVIDIGVKQWKIEWPHFPAEDVYVPFPTTRTQVFEARPGGDLVKVKDDTKLVVWPFTEKVFNLAEFGDEITGHRSKNITKDFIEAYIAEDRNGIDVDVITSFDIDDNNTVVLANYQKPNKLAESDTIFTFEVPFDFYFYGIWEGKTVLDVISDMVKLSGRNVYIDPYNKIHLLPWDDDLGRVDLKSIQIAGTPVISSTDYDEGTKSAAFAGTVEIIEKDTEGVTISTGIRISPNVAKAVKSAWEARSEQPIEIYETDFGHAPADMSVLKRLYVDGKDRGLIRSFSPPIKISTNSLASVIAEKNI